MHSNRARTPKRSAKYRAYAARRVEHAARPDKDEAEQAALAAMTEALVPDHPKPASTVRLLLNRITAALPGLFGRLHPKAIAAALFDHLRSFYTIPVASRSTTGGDSFLHAAPKAAAPVITIPHHQARMVVEAALAAMPPKGEDSLPQDISALATLLHDHPLKNDFETADLVRDCFAQFGAAGIRSKALLAVAQQLARHFGLPTHRPLGTARAWRMLDAVIYESEMVEQLEAIGAFISSWQKTQSTFLCLEHGEIELIELLFEAIDPRHNSPILIKVLDFKVLSNRRLGLLRRIPHRTRKMLKETFTTDFAAGTAYLNATRAFVDRIAKTHPYTPIIDTATIVVEELDKMAEKMRPAAPPPAAGQPQALARITPVKRPASEVAEQQAPQPLAPMPAPTSALPALPALPARPTAPPRPAATDSRPSIASIGVASPLVSGGPLQPPVIPHLPTLQRAPQKRAVPVSAITPKPTVPAAGTAALPKPPAPAPATAIGKIAPPPPRPAMTVATGRIVLSPPSATSSAAPRPAPPTPPAPSASPAPPAASAESGATVTALTIVPKAKRPTITQAVKRHAVMRVLRGESAVGVAKDLGVNSAKLDEWVEAFITAGAGALTPKRRKPPETLSVETLKAKLAEVLATAELIECAMRDSLPSRHLVLLPSPTEKGGPRKKRKS
ncbi:hypothetical protein MCP1_700001 [Candidatus Terasakiella magnetica]|nr:hypothetical protein MCP1_700001 [Candidatus Terasakiella magnetica]